MFSRILTDNASDNPATGQIVRRGVAKIKRTVRPMFCFRRFYVLRWELHGLGGPEKLPTRVEVGIATPADKDAISALVDRGSEIDERLSAGDQCAIAKVSGQVVGMEWLYNGSAYYDTLYNYRIPLDRDEAWVYDGFVKSDFRIRGVWPCIQRYIKQYLQASGYGSALCSVVRENVLSLNSHLRYGYEIVQEVAYLRLGILDFHKIREPKRKYPRFSIAVSLKPPV